MKLVESILGVGSVRASSRHGRRGLIRAGEPSIVPPASAHPRLRATLPLERRSAPAAAAAVVGILVPIVPTPARAGTIVRPFPRVFVFAAAAVESPPAEKKSTLGSRRVRAFAFGDVAVGFGVGAASAGEGLRARERGASSRASSAASARGGSPRARAIVQRR